MSDNLTREVVATKLHEMANEIFGERGPLRLFSDHLAAAVLFMRADAAELTRLRAALAAAQEQADRYLRHLTAGAQKMREVESALAAAQEREQRMREALANIMGNEALDTQAIEIYCRMRLVYQAELTFSQSVPVHGGSLNRDAHCKSAQAPRAVAGLDDGRHRGGAGDRHLRRPHCGDLGALVLRAAGGAELEVERA